MDLPARIKRILIPSAVFFGAAVLSAAAWAAAAVACLPDVNFLAKNDMLVTIQVKDWDGDFVPFTVGPANPYWTPLDSVPPALRDAVVASEDFSFFQHKGVDWFEVKEAIRRDLAEKRAVRGASTITQQLAKNLFLSREKTLLRKIKELVLARRMEKALTKERILELYLNVVELGPLVYGVGAGSRYHFAKTPTQLTLRECAFLAAMLPGPRIYNPYRRLDRVMARADHVLSVMLKGRMISESEYQSALGELPFLPKAAPAPPSIGKTTSAAPPPTEGEGIPAVASTAPAMSGQPSSGAPVSGQTHSGFADVPPPPDTEQAPVTAPDTTNPGPSL